jgi:hypothetical protein
MYGNAPFSNQSPTPVELSPEQRRRLRNDLTKIAARTRELLPEEYIVGSELADGAQGPRATIAVRPPIGSVVSAGYTPEEGAEIGIDADESDELARGLAASAALQVKQAVSDDVVPTAK